MELQPDGRRCWFTIEVGDQQLRVGKGILQQILDRDLRQLTEPDRGASGKNEYDACIGSRRDRVLREHGVAVLQLSGSGTARVAHFADDSLGQNLAGFCRLAVQNHRSLYEDGDEEVSS